MQNFCVGVTNETGETLTIRWRHPFSVQQFLLLSAVTIEQQFVCAAQGLTMQHSMNGQIRLERPT